MRPTNYRTHDFHLFGKDFAIGGMAGPQHNKDRDGALSFLRGSVLIGLHETDFSVDAKRNGVDYHHIPISGAGEKPVAPEVYDAIYDVVKKSVQEGKSVTIHCGAGDGRTGTALAALKLRELLVERLAKEGPRILDENPSETETIYATSVHDRDVACTPLVRQAILDVRMSRNAMDESGSHSVETENDVRSLIEYEKHLRTVLRAELTVEQKAAPRVSSTAAIALGLTKSREEAAEKLRHKEAEERQEPAEPVDESPLAEPSKDEESTPKPQ
jgi:hypothetical protein